MSLYQVKGSQWPSDLKGLTSNHRLSPQCVGSTLTSDNVDDLTQYDTGC